METRKIIFCFMSYSFLDLKILTCLAGNLFSIGQKKVSFPWAAFYPDPVCFQPQLLEFLLLPTALETYNIIFLQILGMKSCFYRRKKETYLGRI
jgi:hypothetical protein